MDVLKRAFTLIELLVVIAIIAILAAILFPVFAQAKEAAKKSACLSNLKQIGMAVQMYLNDSDGLLPDRRDLKAATFKPWTTWPTSDPRTGWAALIYGPYIKASAVWTCPSVAGKMSSVVQVNESGTNYWMWRFDRPDNPVPLDDLWGKSEHQSLADLQVAGNPQVGFPNSVSEIELIVDPYFPANIPSVPTAIKGLSVHFGGRNRGFLDSHVKYLKDTRLKS